MKDVAINKDILDYEEKVLFNAFTMRQGIALGVCVVIALTCYFLIPASLAPLRYAAIILLAGIPGIIGFHTYNKLKGGAYLLMLYKYYFVYPKKYSAIPKHEFYELLSPKIKARMFSGITKSKAKTEKPKKEKAKKVKVKKERKNAKVN